MPKSNWIYNKSLHFETAPGKRRTEGEAKRVCWLRSVESEKSQQWSETRSSDVGELVRDEEREWILCCGLNTEGAVEWNTVVNANMRFLLLLLSILKYFIHFQWCYSVLFLYLLLLIFSFAFFVFLSFVD